MKTRPRYMRPAEVEADGNGQKTLSELLDLLAKQLRLAKNGELEKVDLLSGRVEKLLDELSRFAVPIDQTTAQRIRQLYNALCLVFATEKTELAERLNRMRKGKTSLCAYKDGLVGKTNPSDTKKLSEVGYRA